VTVDEQTPKVRHFSRYKKEARVMCVCGSRAEGEGSRGRWPEADGMYFKLTLFGSNGRSSCLPQYCDKLSKWHRMEEEEEGEGGEEGGGGE